MEKRVVLKNGEGESLAGAFHKINDHKKVIIVCHGYKGNKDGNFVKEFCLSLNREGMNAFRFDFSGSGESEGRFEDATYSKEISDLKCIIDYFYKMGFSIGLVGHSMGATICLMEASTDPRIKFITAVSGVTHTATFRQRFVKLYAKSEKEFDDAMRQNGFYEFYDEEKKTWYKVTLGFFADIIKQNPLEAVKSVHVPVLIVHGDKDDRIDIQESKDLLKAANEPKKMLTIKGADHRFSDKEIYLKMVKKVITWIKKDSGF
jgi:alpha/beta superfamily hydrolase